MPSYCQNRAVIWHPKTTVLARMRVGFKRGELFQTFVPLPDKLVNASTCEEWEHRKNWAYDHWGTRWDVGETWVCHDNKIKPVPGGMKLIFDSRWLPPLPFYENLSKQGFKLRAIYYEPYGPQRRGDPGRPSVWTGYAGIWENVSHVQCEMTLEEAVTWPELEEAFGIADELAQRESTELQALDRQCDELNRGSVRWREEVRLAVESRGRERLSEEELAAKKEEMELDTAEEKEKEKEKEQ